MKKLTVMRHAEAGQASRDFDRPLTDYGKAQSKNVAEQLSEHLSPDYLIISPAARTTETASFLIDEFSIESEKIKYEKSIYEASTNDLVRVISSLPSSCAEAILVGHNPAVSSLVSSLTGGYEGFPTGCAVILEIECDDWNTVVYSQSTLKIKVLPSV